MNLYDIENQTKKYSDARAKVAAIVTSIENETKAIRQRYQTALKNAVADAAEKKNVLKDAIDECPGLFDKPRTHIYAGIKVGYQKQKGKMEIIDEDKTIELIRRKMPEKADLLIITTSKAAKKALEKLSAAELKSIAVNIGDSTDEILINPIDSNIDKIVDTLLKDADDTAE